MAEKPYVFQQSKLSAELQEMMDGVFNVVFPENVEDYMDKVTALIITTPLGRITAETMNSFPALKVIGNGGVGCDYIDVKECRLRGIRVGNIPGVLNDVTADMAFALLLSSARRVVEGDAIAKNSQTTSFDMNWFGYQVSGATIGIVGMGRIGLQVARRARGFDMKVLYHNRNQRPKEVEDTVQATYVPNLHDLLKKSNFVIMVIPASKESYRMIGRAEFAAMKKTAVFINIARGSLVDHNALTEALKTGQLAAAGLDVTDPEPLPRDHPLLSLPNVTITPHMGKGLHYTTIRPHGCDTVTLPAFLICMQLRLHICPQS